MREMPDFGLGPGMFRRGGLIHYTLFFPHVISRLRQASPIFPANNRILSERNRKNETRNFISQMGFTSH